MISPYNDAYFMKQALDEAKKAYLLDEVPVGAVIVCVECIRPHRCSNYCASAYKSTCTYVA